MDQEKWSSVYKGLWAISCTGRPLASLIIELKNLPRFRMHVQIRYDSLQLTFHGILDFFSYSYQEGFCHCGKKEKCAVARIEGFMRVKKHYPKALKFALVTHGPIAASVNADPKTFRFYSNGVYDDPLCSKYVLVMVGLRDNQEVLGSIAGLIEG